MVYKLVIIFEILNSLNLRFNNSTKDSYSYRVRKNYALLPNLNFFFNQKQKTY